MAKGKKFTKPGEPAKANAPLVGRKGKTTTIAPLSTRKPVVRVALRPPMPLTAAPAVEQVIRSEPAREPMPAPVLAPMEASGIGKDTATAAIPAGEVAAVSAAASAASTLKPVTKNADWSPVEPT